MGWGNVQGVGRTIDPSQFSYSGNPAANDKDHVRWLIGDVDKDDPLVTDHEILAALTDEGDNVRRAAASCFEFLASYFAREADRQDGDVRLSLSQRSATMQMRAKDLRALADTTSTLIATPYVGGISKADKELDRENTDRVAPFFTRDMHDFRSEDDDAGWH